jgi:phenylpropionate dioxygenase-like ring-hydroxylating dioxygenase large terminal subunit
VSEYYPREEKKERKISTFLGVFQIGYISNRSEKLVQNSYAHAKKVLNTGTDLRGSNPNGMPPEKALQHHSEYYLFALLPLSKIIGTQTRHLLVYRFRNLSPHETDLYEGFLVHPHRDDGACACPDHISRRVEDSILLLPSCHT